MDTIIRDLKSAKNLIFNYNPVLKPVFSSCMNSLHFYSPQEISGFEIIGKLSSLTQKVEKLTALFNSIGGFTTMYN